MKDNTQNDAEMTSEIQVVFKTNLPEEYQVSEI